MEYLCRTLTLTHALNCGGKLKHEDQIRRRERNTRRKEAKISNRKLRTAVMMRQFCWMIGMIGWIILKYDLCTIGHAAHYLTTNTMIMCTIIKLM